MNATRGNDQGIIQAWLHGVLRSTGMKPTPLAKAAGLAPSTLLRALDPAAPGHLEIASIRKIVAKFGVPPPVLSGGPAVASGFAEPELRELADAPTQFAGLSLTPNQFVREINTRALDLAGYVPGDQILIDMSVLARADDVVIAQVYNFQNGGAETVIRLYDPPYLVTETTDLQARAKPLLVDDERVKIMGTVVCTLRQRSAA